MTLVDQKVEWLAVCSIDDLLADRGVCALVGPYQVAIFRLSSGDLYALSNYDPFSRAYVLSRGIVGSQAGIPKVASPVYKQCFDLRTGQCFEDPSITIMTFPVRAVLGRIDVGLP
jgi:nitrite reductase (NADH) small subunit